MRSNKALVVGQGLIQDLYQRYTQSPDSVDHSWRSYFDGVDSAAVGEPASATGSCIDGHRSAVMLGRLIENYRWRGHLRANLDPLQLNTPAGDAELTLDRLGLSLADPALAPSLEGELNRVEASLPAILARLEEIYCRSIGFEFMHVPNAGAREWLRDAIETGWGQPGPEARRLGLKRLIEAEEFEHFMHRRYPGKKRFGAEGAESLIAWLGAALDHAAGLGAQVVMMGGTSRARLNQMATIVRKPLGQLFAEFYGAPPFPAEAGASGDVAYHLGHRGQGQFGERALTVEYCYNPSHLEAVDTVALGRARALQESHAELAAGQAAVWPVLVHTDAAFAGQGVVAESFQISALQHYTAGGCLHVVINNQLGFTTDPAAGRSAVYCTDFAKAIGVPVFHVNADDVDAVLRTAVLAAEYRQRFHTDVVVDLVCYRRRGHNEADEPAFTQPAMYAAIARRPGARRLYADLLASQGVASAVDEAGWTADWKATMEEGYAQAKADWAAPPVERRSLAEPALATGVSVERLQEVGDALCALPQGLDIHRKVQHVLEERKSALQAGAGIDWALAEALAIGTLLQEGIGLRLSGQDTARGAFSHRHFMLHDSGGARAESVFAELARQHGVRCEVINSPLAEYATLGFEYGYSLEVQRAGPAGRQLVVWEAQFGDFANVAQTIIDQFISSGEDKWMQPSSLVMLLPHGLEGQGAEHSSGRIERMLQLCAKGNMRVANCSTPANYFHLLRLQALEARRPLVIFTPKSLLRHRDAVSALADLVEGRGFQRVIGPGPGCFRRIVLCSGKLYWALAAERTRLGLSDVGLVRLEQLYPFPHEELAAALAPHAQAELVWCQEEPANMGCFGQLDRPIERVLREIGSQTAWPRYVGRPANPSPAMGTFEEHGRDQEQLIRIALGELSEVAAEAISTFTPQPGDRS